MQKSAHPPGVLIQFFGPNHLKDFKSHRAAERRSAKGGAVRAGPEQVRVPVAGPESPDRKPAAEGLRHGDAVWDKTSAARNPLQNALEALKPPSAEVAALDAVNQQEQPLLIAELAQAEQIISARRNDP